MIYKELGGYSFILRVNKEKFRKRLVGFFRVIYF